MSIDQKIAALGLTLPAPAAPVAAYVPTIETGGLLYISGQLPFRKGDLMTGRLGDDVDVVFGQEAAQACALMLIAQMKRSLGSLDRVERIVKLGVFVNSDPRFTDQPKVADGASQLMADIFGEAGQHTRSSVGVPALPRGAAVEIDAVIAVRPA